MLDSNDKTDVFNERKWFRVYVGNPDSYNSNGEPEDADTGTLTMDGDLYHEFDFLYLPGKPGNLIPPARYYSHWI